jgi:acyl-CoA reductase-like NAD-dependent aldehyde dehydrogenase
MKEKAEQRRLQREFDEAQAALRRWEAEVAEAEDMLDAARTFEGFDPAEVDSPLTAKKGERLYLVGEGAGLVEPRRLPGQWVGGHRGVSVRVAKGVYLAIWRVPWHLPAG